MYFRYRRKLVPLIFTPRIRQENRRFPASHHDHRRQRGVQICSGNGRGEENAALENRAFHGGNARGRTVFDAWLWRQAIIDASAGRFSMALLSSVVALARDTIGHDWYSAAELMVAHQIVAVDFDEDDHVDFRTADGVVETITRSRLSDRYRARWARQDILKAAWKSTTLRVFAGCGGVLLRFVSAWRPLDDRRGRRPAGEPAPEWERDAQEGLASLQERPMSGPPPPPTSFAPTNAPADQSPVSSPALSASLVSGRSREYCILPSHSGRHRVLAESQSESAP